MIVLDTNVVSDLMRGGSTNVLTWLRTVSPEDLYTTVITRSEIRYGVARIPPGRRHDELHLRADDFLHEIADRTLASMQRMLIGTGYWLLNGLRRADPSRCRTRRSQASLTSTLQRSLPGTYAISTNVGST